MLDTDNRKWIWHFSRQSPEAKRAIEVFTFIGVPVTLGPLCRSGLLTQIFHFLTSRAWIPYNCNLADRPIIMEFAREKWPMSHRYCRVNLPRSLHYFVTYSFLDNFLFLSSCNYAFRGYTSYEIISFRHTSVILYNCILCLERGPPSPVRTIG